MKLMILILIKYLFTQYKCNEVNLVLGELNAKVGCEKELVIQMSHQESEMIAVCV